MENIYKKILVSFMLCSLLFTFAQNAKADDETKVWDISTLDAIIKWHKTEYNMFKDFMGKEDTIRLVDIDYKAKAQDFKSTDSTLFNQLKDVKISKIHLAFDILDALTISKNILDNSIKITQLIAKQPYVQECDNMAFDLQYKITTRFARLVKTVINKSIVTDNKNLMNNNVRQNLTEYILSELKAMQSVSEETYQILSETKKTAASKQYSEKDIEDLMIINIAPN